MKLEYIFGKYFADGIEITQEQYNEYSKSLQGKNIQINVVKEDDDNSEIKQLKTQITELASQIETLSSQLTMVLGELKNNA